MLYELNERQGRTIVMVLHDLNLACRYAHHMVAVHAGNIYAEGAPESIITPETVKAVFQLDCEVISDPLFGTPLCIPHGKGRRIAAEGVTGSLPLPQEKVLLQRG
ncbi:putative siderophore transport system ATP-binding protein YusV [compost metagenome]